MVHINHLADRMRAHTKLGFITVRLKNICFNIQDCVIFRHTSRMIDRGGPLVRSELEYRYDCPTKIENGL